MVGHQICKILKQWPCFIDYRHAAITWEDVDADLGIDLKRVVLVLGQDHRLGRLDACQVEAVDLLHHGRDQVGHAFLSSHCRGSAGKSEADNATVAACCCDACRIHLHLNLLACG